MNPFDFRGPEFLEFYLLLTIVVLVVSRHAAALPRNRTASESRFTGSLFVRGPQWSMKAAVRVCLLGSPIVL